MVMPCKHLFSFTELIQMVKISSSELPEYQTNASGIVMKSSNFTLYAPRKRKTEG